MDLSQLKKDAKAKLNGKFGNLLLASSLAGIILLVANILPGVGMLLVSGPITFGLEKIYHDASSGKEIDWRDLFRFFEDRWGKTLYLQTSSILHCWLALVVGIGSVILGALVSVIGTSVAIKSSHSFSAVRSAVNAGQTIITIGIIVACVIFLIKHVQTEMANYVLLREPEIDGKEAVKKSAAYMKGHEWQYIWLNITMIPYYLANIFFNYGLPMITITKVDYYTALYENSLSQATNKKVCPSCGEELNEGVQFCTKCGTKIDQ